MPIIMLEWHLLSRQLMATTDRAIRAALWPLEDAIAMTKIIASQKILNKIKESLKIIGVPIGCELYNKG
ncbi:conserved hypothetical protein [Ricinus communis]|uniref:Uncharacterized protein n=1 Tax=Ricinus communis TaxID=3988 RepID=B9T3F7_RICCO|nr:conserved hypothetical protein [Ricinus communis]